MLRRHPRTPPLPYTTLFRSDRQTPSAPPPTKPRRKPFPILEAAGSKQRDLISHHPQSTSSGTPRTLPWPARPPPPLRSEEHTSELQSLRHLVCRLLLEKKSE